MRFAGHCSFLHSDNFNWVFIKKAKNKNSVPQNVARRYF